MFVKDYDNRFKVRMWSDSRLVNKQGIFCLCLSCIKEQYPEVRCQLHQEFMKETRRMNIVAPVFACLEFEENPNNKHFLDKLYEPSQEKIESQTAEAEYKFMKTWEEQKKVWGLDENLRVERKEQI